MPRRPRVGLLAALAVASAALSFAVAPSFAAPIPPAAPSGGSIPASDVVVNVTLGANDPVSGATVVARDDLTGRVVSKTTTTGSLGYAVLRMRPMQSNRRITITATGGTSGVVGKLSRTDDALAATVQRADADAAIEVNVNPATTIQAAYLDLRPGATLANSEKTVARRLRVAPGIPLDEAGRYSRVAFSGEAFARASKGRGGIDSYADWAAQRIARGAALPTYAAPLPPDDLPLRRGALTKQENILGSLVSSALGPLAEYGGRLLFCEIGIAALCPNQTPPPVRLPPEVLEQFNRIEQGITNLQVQLTTIEENLGRIERELVLLSGTTLALNYGPEQRAVEVLITATRVAAGLRAQGRPLPDDTRQALENALERRFAINSGCPNFPALIGPLPSAVLSLHPGAVCTRGGLPSGGLMQYAQRATARRVGVVAAGQTQNTVDAAGDWWLGELAQNIFSANASSAFALQRRISDRDTATTEATSAMFQDVLAEVDADGTGTYFGARIPPSQVLAMRPDGADAGTLYGIGTYRAPGDCRGGTLRPVLHRFSQGEEEVLPFGGAFQQFSASFYLPSGSGFADAPLNPFPRQSLGAIPGWVACTQAQLVEPPAPVPGAPAAAGWQPAARPPAAEMTRTMPFLRSAALCHVHQQTRSASGRIWFLGGGELCEPGDAVRPNQLVVAYGRAMGMLPNLQVSVGSDSCRPWEIGTSQVIPRETTASGGAAPVTPLVTAVGMQCPVIDLTPNASDRDGWNCVSANPEGQVATQPGGNAPPLRVTSSLPWLDAPSRSMGMYCPNWGWQPMPSGSVNYSQHAASLAPSWNPRPNGKLCSPGLRQFPFRQTEGNRVGAGPPDRNVNMPCAGGRLQEHISALTRYWEPSESRPPLSIRSQERSGFRELGISSEAPNWTANNGVAGDFVVGPLYTSNAVGAYVPGLSPGGPAPTGSRLPGGPGPPGAVRDLSVECVNPCDAQNASVRVRWRAPATSGSFSIQRYEVGSSPRGGFDAFNIEYCFTNQCEMRQQAHRPLERDFGGCNTRDTECTIRNVNLQPPAGLRGRVFTVRAVNIRGVAGPTMGRRHELGLDAPTVTPATAALKVRWNTPLARWWRQGWNANRMRWSYTATASPGGRSCTVDATTGNALNLEATTCTITGLDPGVKHTVTVAGTHINDRNQREDLNSSPPSAPTFPGGRARPGAPAIVGVEAHPGRLRIKWSRPESDGFSRITGYTATAQPGGATCTTLDRLACDIDGLENGVEYTVTVTATNELGTGPPSAAITRSTPVLLPSAPRSPLVRESFTRIEVNWSAPESDGGRPVTGYTATASPGGATCTTTGAKGCTIEGLASGTRYAVTVTATNEAGTGPSSEPASAVTAAMTVPGAPGRPSVESLQGGARAAWSAPVSDGGTPVTGYVATAMPGGAQCETTGATECVIRDLAAGTAHRVSVVAINTLGAGAPSPLSDAVTPQQKARAATGAAAGPFGIASPTTVPALPQSGAAAAAQRPLLAGVALRPRTLVPGLGGRLTYTLARPAAITITFTRGAGRGRDRVVRRIPAGRLGALAGDSRVRVLHTPANARRMRAGAWRMTVEARDAAGAVMRRTVPISVRTRR